MPQQELSMTGKWPNNFCIVINKLACEAISSEKHENSTRKCEHNYT